MGVGEWERESGREGGGTYGVSAAAEGAPGEDFGLLRHAAHIGGAFGLVAAPADFPQHAGIGEGLAFFSTFPGGDE